MLRSECKIGLLILLLIPWTGSASTNMKHKARIDYKLKLEYVSQEFGAGSHGQCLAYCSMRPGCISASFKSTAEKCLLSENDTISDAQESIPQVIEFAEGWTTMTRMIYPVFHLLGRYERYSMTFSQAKQQCIDYGTTIASPSDLLEARAMGFDFCSCGWLSNKKNGLVLQKKKNWCLSWFNDKIMYCGKSKANVYCKLK